MEDMLSESAEPRVDDVEPPWRLPSGPSGLGTAALRLTGTASTAPGVASAAPDTPLPGLGNMAGGTITSADGCAGQSPHLRRPELALTPLPYLEREWGDGSYPPLYCPPTVRDDAALGAEVNRRLVAWAEQMGIYPGQLDKFSDTGFGRLAMLTHPDSDDPDMLLVAAQMNAAWWAADDYYADETELGATPTELPPRLALVMSAMDPPPTGKYTDQLEETVRADPVLRSIRSATSHLTRHGTPSQVMRACNATAQMYVSWTASAAWRFLEKPPPVWHYLAARHHDSFYTSMTLIDIVADYELTGNLFYERRFHEALTRAGMASVLVNDLHSVAKEAADELPDSNVVLLIAAEENCSIKEATERTVRLHNEFVRGFESSQRDLSVVGSVELQRFLRGAQAWMGGGLEWHSTSVRYK